MSTETAPRAAPPVATRRLRPSIKVGLAAIVVAALVVVGMLVVRAHQAPRVAVGDLVRGQGSEFTGGTEVPTPLGSFRVRIDDPVTSLDEDQTAGLEARRAPSGGRLVPVSLAFFDPSVVPYPLQTARPSPGGPDRFVLPVVSLRTQSGTYPIGAPAGFVGDAGGANLLILPDTYYVAVPDADPQVSVQIAYGSKTQSVAADGTLDSDVASLLTHPAEVKDARCGSHAWAGEARLASMTCSVIADAGPYDARLGWAPQGRQWLVVRVGTDGPILHRRDGDGYETVRSGASASGPDLLDGARPAKVLDGTPVSGLSSTPGSSRVEAWLIGSPTSASVHRLVLTRAFRDADRHRLEVHQAIRVRVVG